MLDRRPAWLMPDYNAQERALLLLADVGMVVAWIGCRVVQAGDWIIDRAQRAMP